MKLFTTIALLFVTAQGVMGQMVKTEAELKAAVNGENQPANIILGNDITLSSCLMIAQDKVVTLDLNSHTLKRTLNAVDADGHVIEVLKGGTLTVRDGSVVGGGKLSGGRANNGGGICNYGTLTFEGGTITDCYAAETGGGIKNNAGATLTMSGGVILGCFGKDCGGIYNADGGVLITTDGTISGNTSEAGGGGVVNYGTATISGVTIHNNHATTRGGAIWNGGTMTLADAIITDNRADVEGGGLYMNAGSKATLSSVLMRNNTSADAGGIYVGQPATVSITNSVLMGNTSTEHGGGAIANHGTVSLYGGIISGNTCLTQGGGIWNGGTLSMQGLVSVQDNKKSNGWTSNVYLLSGHAINVTGSLDGAGIGVGMQGHAGTVTHDLGINGNLENFSNDYADIANIALNSDGEVVLTQKTDRVAYVERGWDSNLQKVTETLKYVTDYTELTGTDPKVAKPLEKGGWYVVRRPDVKYERVIAPESESAHLIICDGASLSACIVIDHSRILSIYGQTEDSGTLSASNDSNHENFSIGPVNSSMGTLIIHGANINSESARSPGIGSGANGPDNGTLTIYGGTVTAKGGERCAGIGGEQVRDGLTVNIYGGTVTAYGRGGGAGIGSGQLLENSYEPNGGRISIFGGNVYAYGSDAPNSNTNSGAGIGGGGDAHGGTINISGGHVVAYGGHNAAGIGSGEEGVTTNNIDGGTITITGGFVEAWGNGEGAGIGGGKRAASGNITINGGTVIAHGGDNSMAICGHDDSDGLRSIAIGDKMMVNNGQQSIPVHYLGNLLDGRLVAMSSSRDIMVLPCSHPDAACTDNGDTHTTVCSYCLYTLTEPHHRVNGVCSACGRASYWTDEGNYSSSFFERNNIIYISSEADLARMAYIVNSGETDFREKTFELTRDLDMSEHLWIPIGTFEHVLRGNFDGHGHTISGINVNRPDQDCNGLFGHARSVWIGNLVLKNSTIIGGDRTGSVVGYLQNILYGNNMNNVVSYATVKGARSVGGLVGEVPHPSSDRDIMNSLYLGNNVSGTGNNVGAICGNFNSDGLISNDYYTEVGSYTKANEVRAYVVKPGVNPEEVSFRFSGNKGVAHDGKYYAPDGATVNIEWVYDGLDKLVSALSVNGERLTANADGNYSYTIHADGSTSEFVVTVTTEYSGITGDGSEGNPYVITSTAHWDYLARQVAYGKSFEGCFFRLGNDITVTTHVGTKASAFSGTFDGGGHKLTVIYSAVDKYCAPFKYVDDATIKNLHVDGTIDSDKNYTASIIGYAEGNVTLQACRSSVVLIVDNYDYNGGLVGYLHDGYLTIKGCVFDGKIFGTFTNGGGFRSGFVGYAEKDIPVYIKDCLFAPAVMTMNGYYPFAYLIYSPNPPLTLINSYYTHHFVFKQGKEGFRHALLPADLGAELTTYEGSSITAYENGLGFNGYYYNDNADTKVILTDLADNSEIINEIAGKKADVLINGRTLTATDNGDGTWTSRAYTVCLPFDLDIYEQTGNNLDVQYYQLYSVTDEHEFVFHEARYEDVDGPVGEAPNILFAGRPYVVVVHKGELRLEANDAVVTDTPVDVSVVQALKDGEVYDVGEVPTVIGLWRGTFQNISNADATAMMAHTMSSDGIFRRISDAPEYQDAFIGTFRSFFTPYDNDGFYDYTPKYVIHTEGDDDDEFGVKDFPADTYEGDNNYTGAVVGIDVIHTVDRDGTHRYYDLQGRQLRQRPASGLYIEDGKIRFNK